MVGRPRTMPTRLSHADALVLLEGLAAIRHTIAAPDTLDRLAGRIAENVHDWARAKALERYHQTANR